MLKGIRSRKVVLGREMKSALIVFDNGKVESIRQYNSETEFDVTDYGELVIMPALVDTHVHINEPGREEWEGFKTATMAAAAGGITTIIDMPLNSIPATVNYNALQEKVKAAEGKLHVDCGFYGGIIPGNEGELEALANAGVFGFKAFMIDSGVVEFPHVSEQDLRSALKKLSRFDKKVPLLVHAELESQIEFRNENESSFNSFLTTRPDKWETDAIKVLVKLSKEFEYHIHVVHVSSSQSIDIIRKAKDSGLKITAETCPHYLFFSAEEIEDGETKFKCTPPIRSAENREMLWEAVKEGVIDFIVSDHSPCPEDMKYASEGSFIKAWGGISGLQTAFQAVWTGARRRGISLQDISDKMSSAPARFIGLAEKKGSIAEGCEADFLIFDEENKFTVDERKLFCKNLITPYHGRELQGTVRATYLRGKKIYDNGIFTQPEGKVLFSHKASARDFRKHHNFTNQI